MPMDRPTNKRNRPSSKDKSVSTKTARRNTHSKSKKERGTAKPLKENKKKYPKTSITVNT